LWVIKKKKKTLLVFVGNYNKFGNELLQSFKLVTKIIFHPRASKPFHVKSIACARSLWQGALLSFVPLVFERNLSTFMSTKSLVHRRAYVQLKKTYEVSKANKDI
jgi:hypothetical protein